MAGAPLPLAWSAPLPLEWSAPWPLGLVAAVLAGALLWSVGRRLRVSPASRAAAISLYGCAASLVEFSDPGGLDGTPVLLLAAGAWLAVGGARRNALAACAGAGALVAAPVAAIGLFVLLGGMALTGDLGLRRSDRSRVAIGWVGLCAAAAVFAALAWPAPPPTTPTAVPAMLTAWTALLVGLIWTRQRWLRPAGAAVLALAAAAWMPGPGSQAAVLAAATAGLLTVVVAEQYGTLLARRVLAAATVTAALAAAILAPGRLSTVSSPPDAALPLPAVGSPVRPIGLAIPRLGLSGPLGELSVDEIGELHAPDDPALAGWYAAGVVPGDIGPAILGGHVDSRRGPGVFFELRSLRPGDVIEVARSDRRTARFTVRAVRMIPKGQFPTVSVYGPTPGPELRLVTCGGRFDRTARSYDDNVVVEAVPA